MEEAHKNAFDFTLFSMKPQPEFEFQPLSYNRKEKMKSTEQ